MDLEENVNLRAARNLVNTTYATREQQRKAVQLLEADIRRQERAVRRQRMVKHIYPAFAATGGLLAVATAAWMTGGIPTSGTPLALGLLAAIAVPTVAAMFTAEVLERQHVAAELHHEHLLTKRTSLLHLLDRMNVTVADSERELAKRQREAVA